jgi:hypothetical protein
MPASIYIINTLIISAIYRGIFFGIKNYVKSDISILYIKIFFTWVLIFTFWYLAYFYESNSYIDYPGEEWFLLKRLIAVAICVFGLPLILPDVLIMISKQLNDSGKQWLISILTAVFTYFIITFSQFVSDYAIRTIIQTNPDQFPGAQRALTAIFSLSLWFSILIIISLFFLMHFNFNHSKSNPLKSIPFKSITGTITGLFFILFVIPDIIYLSSASSTFPDDKQEIRSEFSIPILVEQILIWSSFTKNSLPKEFFMDKNGIRISDDKKFCINIPADSYVSPVSPDEVIPNKVVVAEFKQQNIANSGLGFTYRLASCENSNNPDRVE